MRSARNRRERRADRAQGLWVPLRRATLIPLSEHQVDEQVRHACLMAPGLDPEEVKRLVGEIAQESAEVWKNDRYQVHVIPWPALKINGRSHPIVQLSIRRLDRGPARDWRDFQTIKNELLGSDVEAIELYPAESRLIDTANQFHLWCVIDPLFRFPFGYTGRMVTSENIGGAVQRPRPQTIAAGDG